jgi:LPXTG-motif cell wall-anchored protein
MSGRRSPLVRTVAGLVSMLTGTVVLMAALPGGAGASEEPSSVTSSSVVEGNPTCAELGEFDHEFKIDAQPEVGTYDDPESDLVVTITDVTEGDPMTFSFTTNFPVSAVFVKSGPGGILYTFDPPTTVGTDLASPNDSISHVSFCWDEDETTTTEDHESTTTEKDHESTTTEQHETTTTEKATTTTTVEGETTTTAAEVVTTPTTAPPTTTPEGELPRTGSTMVPLVAIGALLLTGGFALLLTTRLRRS